MKPEAQKVVDDAANRQVPQAMLDNLAKADDKLRDARAELARANAGNEIGHGKTVTEATDHVRDAEKEVESASDAISKKMSGATNQPEKK